MFGETPTATETPPAQPVISERMQRKRDLEGYAKELGFSDAEAFLTALCPDENGVIIDMGSGAGNFSKGIKEKRSNWRVFSFDLQPLGGENPVAMDFSTIPVKDGSVDAIVGSNSIGMYTTSEEGVEKSIKEMSRILKSGGKAMINIFHPMYLGDLGQEYHEQEQTDPSNLQRFDKLNFTFYTPDRQMGYSIPVIKLLKDAGFQIKSIRQSLGQPGRGLYAVELVKL